jgi:hypothetical protein
MITATGWRPIVKGALRGFVDLELQPSGLILHGCTVMVQGERRWIGLPARPQTARDGSPILGPAGKPAWAPIVEIPDRVARERFQAAALAAVDRIIGRQP